ncbi:MAG: DNA mismatch endonuclease Vsr [Paludibacteraceae bacterium]|nr:DNA mismatch endonuclease Vsr [Paludibacteraceae bacterium]
MPDTLSPAQRHRVMSHIRSRGTKPEIKVRRWLWRHGYRYRLNVRSVPGKPDIVLRRYHTAIFVNGCFWHGHERCGKYRLPKTNTAFWETKINRNRERDQADYQALLAAGWYVMVVWECQLQGGRIEAVMRRVQAQLDRNLLDIHRPAIY